MARVNVTYVNDIRDVYHVGPELGSGSFGRVSEVRRIDGARENLVIKMVSRNGDYVRELDHLVSARMCGNVLPLIEANITNNHMYMEFPKADRDLWKHISLTYGTKTKQRTLAEALHVITHILNTLTHMHDRGIAHRDLKAENVVVLYDESKNPTPWIIDYGMSKRIGIGRKDVSEYEIVTSSYRAPELWTASDDAEAMDSLAQTDDDDYDDFEEVSGKLYDHKIDVWSAGCILYELLTGQRPFYLGKSHSSRSTVRSRIGAHINFVVGDCVEYNGIFEVQKGQPKSIDLCRDVIQALNNLPGEHASSVQDQSFEYLLQTTLRIMTSLMHPRPELRCSAYQAREMLNSFVPAESRVIDDETMNLMKGHWVDYEELDGSNKDAALSLFSAYMMACSKVHLSPRIAFLSIYIWVRSLCLAKENILKKYSIVTLLVACMKLSVSYTGNVGNDAHDVKQIKSALRKSSARDTDQIKREDYAQLSVLTLLGGRIWSTNPGDLRDVHLDGCKRDVWNKDVDLIIMQKMYSSLRKNFIPPCPESVINETKVEIWTKKQMPINSMQLISKTIEELRLSLDDLMES